MWNEGKIYNKNGSYENVWYYFYGNLHTIHVYMQYPNIHRSEWASEGERKEQWKCSEVWGSVSGGKLGVHWGGHGYVASLISQPLGVRLITSLFDDQRVNDSIIKQGVSLITVIESNALIKLIIDREFHQKFLLN